MEVKSGYKQTEIGVIPEDWSERSIHQFATIKTGPFGTLLKASEYSDGDGVPLISVSEIREGFLRVNDGTPRVSEAVTRRLPQYVLRRGDIVFGRKGAVERSALIRREEDGWFLGSDGISIRPVQDYQDEYLAFQFQSARVRGWLIQNAIGTTMPSLNQEVLRNVVIPFPPTKAEQEAIAEALSDADALIESLEQLLTKKHHLKQGAMQELLTGKKRLPGFSGEWEVKALRDVCVKIQDGTHFSPTIRGGKYLYVTSKNIGYGTFDIKDAPRIDEDQHRAIYRRCDPKRGDLLLTKDGASTGNAALNTLDEEFSLLSSVALLRFDPEVYDASYFLQQILSHAGQAHIKDQMSGNAITRLTLAKINHLRFPVCEILEQRAIASILSDMDAEIAALEAKLAKARQLKQGMMQELLTGRIRLV